MEKIARIKLNKNRGWRGLAELICEDSKRDIISKNIFSFSQNMWCDLLKGYIVLQDEDNYIILNFDNVEKLPKPTQQRSVLIKDFSATIIKQWTVSKDTWRKDLTFGSDLWTAVNNYLMNNNNHTTSDWNCIGIRVVPII